MDCTLSLWLMGIAGFIAGAGIAGGVTMALMGRVVRQREGIIDELVWQRDEFEKVLPRDQTYH